MPDDAPEEPSEAVDEARRRAAPAKEHAGPARSAVRKTQATPAVDVDPDVDSARVARLQSEIRSAEYVRDNLPPEVAAEDAYGLPGRPFSSHSPFVMGFAGAAGALIAFFIGTLVLRVGSSLILIVVAMFLAVGLNPAVEFLMHRGLRRSWAVLVVICGVLLVLALFLVAIVPVIGSQVATLTHNAPGWLNQLQHNQEIEHLNAKYHFINKMQSYISSGDLTKRAFGGVVGIGVAILSALANAFVIVVLTLYFLASLPTVKRALYQLAPRSRRGRVSALGDQILSGIGGYVSGAFIVAMCAGVSTLIFLFIVGMGQYAVALAAVVALLDVIPMIGATIGAVIVCAIGFATDVHTGILLIIFYIVYQQIENYLIYPRVMSRSVDIPGAMTVIAALIGAGLLGVVGALLAIPTAAALLLLAREVVVRRQDER